MKKIIDYKKRAKYLKNYIKFPFRNTANFNKKQKQFITRQWNHYKHFNGIRHIVLGKKELKSLKSRGYAVSDKGLFIDDYRDSLGNKIPGSSVQLLNGGIVKVTLRAKGQRIVTRTDYIYQFTKNEASRFIQEPEGFIIDLINKTPVLKKNFDPDILRTKPTRQHIRFQFNAFSSHKALSLDVLDFYIKEKKQNPKSIGFFDGVTGLRFVKFAQIKRKKPK